MKTKIHKQQNENKEQRTRGSERKNKPTNGVYKWVSSIHIHRYLVLNRDTQRKNQL